MNITKQGEIGKHYLPGGITKNFIALGNFFLKVKLLISLTSVASSLSSFLVILGSSFIFIEIMMNIMGRREHSSQVSRFMLYSSERD